MCLFSLLVHFHAGLVRHSYLNCNMSLMYFFHPLILLAKSECALLLIWKINKQIVQSNKQCCFVFGLGSSHHSLECPLFWAPSSAVDQVKAFKEWRRGTGSDLKCHQEESCCSKIKCRLVSVTRQPETSPNTSWDLESFSFIKKTLPTTGVLCSTWAMRQ